LEAFGTILRRFWSENGVGVGNCGFSKNIEKTTVFRWISVFGGCLGARKLGEFGEKCMKEVKTREQVAWKEGKHAK